MTVIADLIMIILFGLLCWKLTDGFRRNVAFMIPLLLVAGAIRFLILPHLFKAMIAF